MTLILKRQGAAVKCISYSEKLSSFLCVFVQHIAAPPGGLDKTTEVMWREYLTDLNTPDHMIVVLWGIKQQLHYLKHLCCELWVYVNDSDAGKYLKRGKPRHICMLLHFIKYLKVCNAVSLKFIIFTVLFFLSRLALTLGLRERERSWATFWLPWGKLLPRKTDLLIKTVQTQIHWAVLVLFWWWPLITMLTKIPLHLYLESLKSWVDPACEALLWAPLIFLVNLELKCPPKINLPAEEPCLWAE